MPGSLALVLYYAGPNRQSFNALAGALETDPFFDGVPVSFPRRDDDLLRATAEALAARARTVVGLSLSTVQAPETRDLVRRLRAEFGAKAIVVAGGPHPTADPAGTLALGVDVVVRGEGEETLLEFLRTIAAGEDAAGVKGIAFRDEKGAVRLTEPRPWIDLDAYPPFGARHHKIGAVEITRGCPHACGFCQTTQLHGGRPRHRSVEKLVQAVDLMHRTGLRDVRLLSPTAFSYGSPDGIHVNLAAVEELLSGLRRVLGTEGRLFFGSFPSEVRPEHVTAESLALLKRCTNNDNIVLGAQSGSDRMLALCHRGHTVDDIFSAVGLALKAGLAVNVDFILDLPGATEEDMDQTAAAMEKLAALGARIHAHSFLPLPQTALASAQPGRLSKRLLGVAYRLMGRGLLYGQWQAQAEQARRLAALTPSSRLVSDS